MMIEVAEEVQDPFHKSVIQFARDLHDTSRKRLFKLVFTQAHARIDRQIVSVGSRRMVVGGCDIKLNVQKCLCSTHNFFLTLFFLYIYIFLLGFTSGFQLICSGERAHDECQTGLKTGARQAPRSHIGITRLRSFLSKVG